MKYIEKFFNWNCKIDIMTAIPNFGAKPLKEITEAMAIQEVVSRITFSKPDQYYMLDLCAGVGLAGIFCAFTTKVKDVVCIDQQVRVKNDYSQIRKFRFLEGDIYDDVYLSIVTNPVILTAVHPCKNLAKRVIEIYNSNDQIKELVIIPCCTDGDIHNRFINDKMGSYFDWCLHLEKLIENSHTSMRVDNNILSPKNVVLYAKKN